MNKARKKPVPLAVWSGTTGKVRLLLPKHMVGDLSDVLLDMVQVPELKLNSAPIAMRAAVASLAGEMMNRTPIVRSLMQDTQLRMTVPKSEALTLLSLLLSSPRTDDAAAPLRILIDALHRLLS